jgi:hypothetical protein
MSQSALARVRNLAADDLFLNFDADEIPKRDVRHFFYFFLSLLYV